MEVSVPLGTIKSLGPIGPKYKVERFLRELDNGDCLMEIAMIDTGEKVEYSLIHIIDDPLVYSPQAN